MYFSLFNFTYYTLQRVKPPETPTASFTIVIFKHKKREPAGSLFLLKRIS